ncbi:MAG: hypothetical protein ACK493_05825 [Planctomycetota bacterium]|jgi:hypothetical protein|nr:hypothetical protein [Blastopirellula sp.]
MKSNQPFRGASIPLVKGTGLTELQWTAWQYLMDDLEPGQAADFEQRLAGDPTAAEALEQMLCLLAELEAAGAEADSRLPSTAAPEHRKTNGTAVQRTVRWLTALAAVLLVFLSISRLVLTPRKELHWNRVEASLENEDLAESWASSFVADANISTEEAAEELQASENWLYSALVSLESLENWPSEMQGGS